MHVTRQYTDVEVADLLDVVSQKLGAEHPDISRGVLAEASKRLRSGMTSKTLAQHLEESVLARHAWPIKRAVGMRLQAVPTLSGTPTTSFGMQRAAALTTLRGMPARTALSSDPSPPITRLHLAAMRKAGECCAAWGGVRKSSGSRKGLADGDDQWQTAGLNIRRIRMEVPDHHACGLLLGPSPRHIL